MSAPPIRVEKYWSILVLGRVTVRDMRRAMVQFGDWIAWSVESVDWRLPSVGERIEVTIHTLHMSEVETVYL